MRNASSGRFAIAHMSGILPCEPGRLNSPLRGEMRRCIPYLLLTQYRAQGDSEQRSRKSSPFSYNTALSNTLRLMHPVGICNQFQWISVRNVISGKQWGRVEKALEEERKVQWLELSFSTKSELFCENRRGAGNEKMSVKSMAATASLGVKWERRVENYSILLSHKSIDATHKQVCSISVKMHYL